MIANPVFLDPNYQWISLQCTALKDFHTRQGDKLAIENDQFVVSEGGFTQSFKRTFLDCLKGGYNREAVVSHFEKLWTKVDTFVTRLRADPQYLADPGIRPFAKQLDLIRQRVGDAEFSYRSAFRIGDDTCSKLNALFKRFSQVSRSLNQELHIEEENSLDGIPWRMPVEQTVAQTVELAKSCVVSTTEKISAFALWVFLFVIGSIPCTALSMLKWTLWNPLEFVLRGKITTDTPIFWLGENAGRLYSTLGEKEFRYSLYTRQLLHGPIITEEHVNAFRELSSQADIQEISLFTARTYDRDEIRPHSPYIDLPVLLRLIRFLRELSSCQKVQIPVDLVISSRFRERHPQRYQNFLLVDQALRDVGFQRLEHEDYSYVRVIRRI